MKGGRDLKKFTQHTFDLLIVGGGIYGACAAWEAASRRLSVALVEKWDFGHASSANHLKMVHGGIRYLQHADIKRIRESSYERSAMLRIAPHLVEPLPIMIPTYGHGKKGKEILGAGMACYDLVTCDRNRGIEDPSRRIPNGSFVPREQALDEIPGLDRDGLTGAAVFNDGQVYSPPRLTISFIRSAIGAGALAANYIALEDISISAGRVIGAKLLDSLTGESLNISCKNILLTTGGWTQQLLETTAGLSLQPGPVFSRDLAFVINRPLVQRYGFACPLQTKDADAVLDRGGRHLFVAPWRNCTLVGVWHEVYREKPEYVSTTVDELKSFLAEVNAAHPDFSLSLDDISMVLTGLTLFGEEGDQAIGKMSFGKRSMLVDHQVRDQIDGLVSLIGVRATTARGMAQKAVEMIAAKNNIALNPSMTARIPIFGGDIKNSSLLLQLIVSRFADRVTPEALYALSRNYGSEYERVMRYAQEQPELLQPLGSSNVLGAEVVHAVKEEMSVKLADVVFRRTDLGTTGDVSEEALHACGRLMADVLGWDEAALEKEQAEVRKHLEKKGFLSNNFLSTDTDVG